MYDIKANIVANIDGAARTATLQDTRIAAAISEYAAEHNYRPEEAMAIAVRYGMRSGKIVGRAIALQAYQEIRQLTNSGATPRQRILYLAKMIHKPNELRNVAKMLTDLAAKIEVGDAMDGTNFDGELAPVEAFQAAEPIPAPVEAFQAAEPIPAPVEPFQAAEPVLSFQATACNPASKQGRSEENPPYIPPTGYGDITTYRAFEDLPVRMKLNSERTPGNHDFDVYSDGNKEVE